MAKNRNKILEDKNIVKNLGDAPQFLKKKE